MENNLKDIYDTVKSDFCNLVNYKLRGNTIEIVTGVPTMNGHLVSVFISNDNGVYCISDGGWVDKEYYGNKLFEDRIETLTLIQDQYSKSFEVKELLHNDQYKYYYKCTKKVELISGLVFELSNYIASIINSQILYYLEEIEQTKSKRFHTEVNQVLRDTYQNDLSTNDHLVDHKDELQSIKFDAVIRRPSNTYLIMYVTGYNSKVFIDDACRATVSFQIAKHKPYFKMTAIIDQFANGYEPNKAREYLAQLENEANNGFILYNSGSIVQQIVRNIPLASNRLF